MIFSLSVSSFNPPLKASLLVSSNKINVGAHLFSLVSLWICFIDACWTVLFPLHFDLCVLMLLKKKKKLTEVIDPGTEQDHSLKEFGCHLLDRKRICIYYYDFVYN